jgi:streptogramin lyase
MRLFPSHALRIASSVGVALALAACGGHGASGAGGGGVLPAGGNAAPMTMGQNTAGGAVNPGFATSGVVFTEYALPTANAGPNDIVSDGTNLWFTETSANQIGRITTGGSISEFGAGISAGAGPTDLKVVGSAIWFTENSCDVSPTQPKGGLGMISTSGGTATEFTNVPNLPNCSYPYDLAVGPDGQVWFTESGSTAGIAEMTTDGATVTQKAATAPASQPNQMAKGPDGTIWFVEVAANLIGHIDSLGGLHEYLIPTPAAGWGDIVDGGDGNMWFTEFGANKIGKIGPTGAFTEYPVPTANSGPGGMVVGADGKIWFTEFNTNALGAINPADGSITEYAIPATALNGGSPNPNFITLGPDGNLWFTESGSNAIGEVSPAGLTNGGPAGPCIAVLKSGPATEINGSTINIPACGMISNSGWHFNGSVVSAGSIGYPAGTSSKSNGTTFTEATPAPSAAATDPCPQIQGCAYLTNSPPATSPCKVSKYSANKGSVTLTPGVYCKGLDLNNTSATFMPGLYVITGGDFHANNSTLNGSGVTFYLATDGLDVNGTQINLSAPTSGNTAGVLFYEPQGNTDDVHLNAPRDTRCAPPDKDADKDRDHNEHGHHGKPPKPPACQSPNNFTGLLYFPNATFRSEGSLDSFGVAPSIVAGRLSLNGTTISITH